MTVEIPFSPDFVSWRQEARRLLSEGVRPEDVVWLPAGEDQGSLQFGSAGSQYGPTMGSDANAKIQAKASLRVPRDFVEAAELAAVHRDPRRWQVLYRILWRLTHGEPHLLNIEVDDDILLLRRMAKAVGRDIHKMHAFVRFRKVTGLDQGDPDDTIYVAWHCPDHAIVRLAVPFFVRRFRSMKFAILTPDGSAFWDQQRLEYGPGVPEGMAPRLEDDLESLWCSYYGAIFNPARIKIKAMKREMPVRHWRTLPETALIGELLASSEARVAQMLREQPTSAAAFVPKDPTTLDQLQVAAATCAGCPLSQAEGKVVFSVGPVTAKIVIVGEQPDETEERSGRGFTGQSGQLLMEALGAAGIRSEGIYFTNAVKHFKATLRGQIRVAKKPEAREVAACRPWLAAELKLIKPEIVICLGTTAALSVLGRLVRIADERGRWLTSTWSKRTLVTSHPQEILKIKDEGERALAMAQLIAELKLVHG